MGVNGVVISCVKDVSVTCRVRKCESALLLISHVKNVRQFGSHVNLCCNESCYKKKKRVRVSVVMSYVKSFQIM